VNDSHHEVIVIVVVDNFIVVRVLLLLLLWLRRRFGIDLAVQKRRPKGLVGLVVLLARRLSTGGDHGHGFYAAVTPPVPHLVVV
jgi:hypothetical protein